MEELIQARKQEVGGGGWGGMGEGPPSCPPQRPFARKKGGASSFREIAGFKKGPFGPGRRFLYSIFRPSVDSGPQPITFAVLQKRWKVTEAALGNGSF